MNEDTTRDARANRDVIDRDAVDRAEADRGVLTDRDVDVDPEVAVDPALRDPTLRDADGDLALTGTSDTGSTLAPDTIVDIRDTGGELEPDFTDAETLTDPVAAVGPSSSAEDPASGGDEVYTPPTDPVVTTNETGGFEVLGGFSATSMDSAEVARSASDSRLGDEAIEDAIRRELREDAATTDLQIQVVVRQGVARLRGTVGDLDDAENAEAVASRVPGVREVIEELEVAEL